MSNRFRTRCKAFSLVELVVALAICSLLFVAILGVLRLANQRLERALRDEKQSSAEGLIHLLRQDLTTTHRIRELDGWIELEGEFPNAGSNVLPDGTIRYGLIAGLTEGSQALIRSSTERSDVVSLNVDSLTIERLDAYNEPQPLSRYYTQIASKMRITVTESRLTESGSDRMQHSVDLMLY